MVIWHTIENIEKSGHSPVLQKKRSGKMDKAKKFITTLNQYNISIYKWVYAKQIDYTYDPRHDDPDYNRND